MFKASSFFKLTDHRTWSDLWLDNSYASEHDVDLSEGKPGPIYKSGMINKWNDNSEYDKVSYYFDL